MHPFLPISFVLNVEIKVTPAHKTHPHIKSLQCVARISTPEIKSSNIRHHIYKVNMLRIVSRIHFPRIGLPLQPCYTVIEVWQNQNVSKEKKIFTKHIVCVCTACLAWTQCRTNNRICSISICSKVKCKCDLDLFFYSP